VSRTVHFLYRVRFSDLLLGPELRLWHLAHQVAEAGHRVVVHVQPGSRNPFPPGIEFRELVPGFMSGIARGDAIVASELLPARAALELLGSRRAFHWDCYGLSLPETLSFTRQWSFRRSLGDRRRKFLRYRMMFRGAERTWVSHEGQAVFLASLLAVSRSPSDAWRAFHSPDATLAIPMGVSELPRPEGTPNPYPAALRERPVLLWGGGIWNWFDVPTVVRAMSHLQELGAPHALFFLSGRNEATSDYDRPLDDALRAAGEAGLLGTSIFFNETRVTPDRLGPWLEHASAGIMGNLPTLESRLSWRTRYLDLLWAGRPLVASGSDPLADRMHRNGAAVLARTSDPRDLARAILESGSSHEAWSKACEASLRFGRSLRWSSVVLPFLAELERPDTFTHPAPAPASWELLRYGLGI